MREFDMVNRKTMNNLRKDVEILKEKVEMMKSKERFTVEDFLDQYEPRLRVWIRILFTSILEIVYDDTVLVENKAEKISELLKEFKERRGVELDVDADKLARIPKLRRDML